MEAYLLKCQQTEMEKKERRRNFSIKEQKLSTINNDMAIFLLVANSHFYARHYAL